MIPSGPIWRERPCLLADPVLSLPLKSSHIESLLSWLDESGIDYPWGDNPTAYRVWISEVMLQQTVVTAAVEHFRRWMLLFPDIPALAAAEEQEVLKAWEGLGYYSRARNLHKGARYLMESCGGSLPDSYGELLKVPGIGDYTARAVLSLALGKPYPVLDANVRRIGQRLTAFSEWSPALDRELLELLDGIIPPESPGKFNAALMQLGQQVCRTGIPRCDECSLQEVCRARLEGLETFIPARKKRQIKEKHTVLFLLLKGREILLYRRSRGIGQGLWFLPGAEISQAEKIRGILSENAGEAGVLQDTVHLYTTWKDWLHTEIYQVKPDRDIPAAVFPLENSAEVQWVDIEKLGDFPTPSVYRKILDQAYPILTEF